MRADDLFAIDVAAEVATLCGAQIQGPWQVPAELVRLANARGVARVEIDRVRGGLSFRCDGALADPEELSDVFRVFDVEAPRMRRQAAIARVEAAGLSALLWATGLPGARLSLVVRTGGGTSRMEVRGARVALEIDGAETGPPLTTLTWRCRGVGSRRAIAWMRTALRFVPFPVEICNRPIERGFPDGLYRMRITDPLPGELALTSSGDAPTLWLLEHGVLSARAVVPGFPAFSAAVEMSGEAPVGSSADDLRAAANPHLEGLLDEAVRMMLLLVDRLPSVDEAVRSRLTTLLLRSAALGRRREQVLGSPIVRVREGSRRRMESPSAVAARVADLGGVVLAVEPGTGEESELEDLVIEATTEQRSLLTELLDIGIEGPDGGRRTLRPGPAVVNALDRGWRRLRSLWGPRALDRGQLTQDELRLVESAAAAGVDLAMCDGAGRPRRCRSACLVSRDRPEVRAAAITMRSGDPWLYPALLAVAGNDLDIPHEIRDRWRLYLKQK
jgi:hypothetical protein